MKKLIGMTDYVLEQWEFAGKEEIQKYYSIAKYAYFLKQPLTLGMFVPCDENGNVLEETDQYRSCEKGWKYGQAKENVLFEGFQYLKDEEGFYLEHDNLILFPDEFGSSTLESLVNDNLKLTDIAIKQL
jgi:hypothetical protein